MIFDYISGILGVMLRKLGSYLLVISGGSHHIEAYYAGPMVVDALLPNGPC